MSDCQTDVVIAGGGLAGCTLAHLLSGAGIRCILINTGKTPLNSMTSTTQSRSLAITPASANILASINIWQKLPRLQLGLFNQMHVWDEQSGGEIRFDSTDINEPLLGYIVEQQLLQQQLTDTCAYLPGCNVINGETVTSVINQTDSVVIELDTEDRIQAQLLVAADSSNSPIRKLVGLEYKRHDYQQQAVTCLATSSLPHENVARQRFLPGGPLAFLPTADPSVCGIVWSTDPDHARSLLSMDETQFCSQLEQAFEYRLGNITACGDRSRFDLFRAHAPEYIHERTVLVGDAAHTVHPLAGQGANLGLLDVAVLAELISQARQQYRNPFSQRVLRHYQRWRKLDNQRMLVFLDALKYLFAADNSLFINLRGYGLNTVNSIPCLKSRIMRHAMGLEAELPGCAMPLPYAEIM